MKKLRRLLLTPVGRRIPVGKNGAPHGVALMTVLLALALLSAVVTDMGSNEMIRYRLAVNDRDSLKAQALSESALNVSRLVLAVQAAVQPMLTQLAATGIPLPAHTVWQLVPMDSEILKGLTSGELQTAFGMDVSASLAKRKEDHAARLEERKTAFDDKKSSFDDENLAIAGSFEPPEGGFGAFDGEFRVDSIVDEEQKAATLRGWTRAVSPKERYLAAVRLNAVFASERYDFLFEDRDSYGQRTDRAELVANIYDWMDDNEDATDPRAEQNDWGRSGGGAEESLYTPYGKVRPKDAYFDSQQELALVRGMTDAHMTAFGPSISIYGEGNKVNILSAPLESMEALVRICALSLTDPLLYQPQWMAETMQTWNQSKQMGPLLGGFALSADGFMAFLDSRGLAVDQDTCKKSIGTESRNFTIKATATVGDVTRVTTTVVNVYGADEVFYYYAVR
jgi:hypothetical protein